MKKLIIANWKLNPLTAAEARRLAGQIDRKPKNTAVLCPPHLFLAQIKYPNLGAQDCFWEDKGPFTGQVSPLQLKKLKIKYCIVGHSERRSAGDDDHSINTKIKALQKNGITPILCVGYGTTAEEDDMEVVDMLRKQLEMGLIGAEADKVTVAYEPVWAISNGDPFSTKKIATPEHAEKISMFIKSRFPIKRVLYGGSSNVFNAKGFLDQPNIDGLLVGGDSLSAKHFNQIINF